jgi:hypothetical protein
MDIFSTLRRYVLCSRIVSIYLVRYGYVAAPLRSRYGVARQYLEVSS